MIDQQLVELVMDDELVEDVDEVAKQEGFSSRDEFIRATLQDAVEDYDGTVAGGESTSRGVKREASR